MTRRRRGARLGAAAVCVAALAAGAASATTAADVRTSRIIARIGIQGHPFRVRAGAGSVWVISRPFATGCSPGAPCSLVRIDPGTNRVVGAPLQLPGDPWDLAVGAGAVWIAGFDGRILRIDARSGHVEAEISARPVFLGAEIAYGGGYVWTGNDDERYKQGSTVSKIDPRANRVVGEPLVLGSPQSLAFGAGALWVADHSGWLVKIDPKTLTVIARRRLDFGPHGVVVLNGAVYVADAHADRLIVADAATGGLRRVAQLRVGAIYPAAGAESLWSGSSHIWGGSSPAHDDRIIRIDPATLKIAETIHAGGNVTGVAYGFGSVWAAVTSGTVLRIAPG